MWMGPSATLTPTSHILTTCLGTCLPGTCLLPEQAVTSFYQHYLNPSVLGSSDSLRICPLADSLLLSWLMLVFTAPERRMAVTELYMDKGWDRRLTRL